MFLTFGWKLFLQINENADPLREVKINGDKEAVYKKKKITKEKKCIVTKVKPKVKASKDRFDSFIYDEIRFLRFFEWQSRTVRMRN